MPHRNQSIRRVGADFFLRAPRFFSPPVPRFFYQCGGANFFHRLPGCRRHSVGRDQAFGAIFCCRLGPPIGGGFHVAQAGTLERIRNTDKKEVSRVNHGTALHARRCGNFWSVIREVDLDRLKLRSRLLQMTRVELIRSIATTSSSRESCASDHMCARPSPKIPPRKWRAGSSRRERRRTARSSQIRRAPRTTFPTMRGLASWARSATFSSSASVKR